MRNKVYLADNLDLLRKLPSESVDLVYIDPPFNTGKRQRKRNAKMSRVEDGSGTRTGFGDARYVVTELGTEMAYDDSYDSDAYLSLIRTRLSQLHRILKPTGSLYLHLDYREVHYAKVVGDQIFGRDNFLNEIIWAYDYGAKAKTRWPPKHDNILVWAKQRGNHVFNVDDIDREPYMAPGMVTEEKALRGKLPTDCYSSDTEVLTSSGWKLFSDIRAEDCLATVTPQRELLYVLPSALQAHPYDGPMVHCKSKTVDLLVTPTHRMYAKPKHSSEFSFVAAENLDSWQYVSLLNRLTWVGETQTHFEVPSVPYLRPGKPLPPFEMGDWLEFLGWYLSEGCTVKYRDRYETNICQIKPDYQNSLRELLTRMGLSWHYDGRSYIICNKQLTLYMNQFGLAENKHIPRAFLDLSPKYLERLYLGLMMGDGSVRDRFDRGPTSRQEWCYHTVSPVLASQVHELILKLGYGASTSLVQPKEAHHLPKYVVYRRHAEESTLWRDRHLSTVPYSGVVYCATVEPHHTLVVRRNGKSAVCGNCWWHTIVPTNGKEKTGYPTQKPLGVLKRIIIASSPPGGLVLDCFAGSGTTGEACLLLGRHFILVDNNNQAVRVMRNRFAPYMADGAKIGFLNRLATPAPTSSEEDLDKSSSPAA